MKVTPSVMPEASGSDEEETLQNPIRHPLSIACVAALLITYLGPIVGAQAQDCAPVINLDTPTGGSIISTSQTFGGWVVDQDSTSGNGIISVQIVADDANDQGTVLGTATEIARPDADAAMGMPTYGFTLTADLSNLSAGAHTFSAVAMTECGPSTGSVVATLQPMELAVDGPAPNASFMAGSAVDITGWTSGSRVDVYLDEPAGQTGAIASGTPDIPRPDVVQATSDPSLANSGFDIEWPSMGLDPGNHTLYIYSLINGVPDLETVPVVATAPTASASTTTSTTAITTPSTQSSLSYYSGNCNPDYPDYNYTYPSNAPCTSANLYNCNPSYPEANTLYPTNLPCNSTAASVAGACNPFYPSASTEYPNDIPCPGTSYSLSGLCNPLYPAPSPTYPNDVPCSSVNMSAITACNPTYPLPNATYPNNVQCQGQTSTLNGGSTTAVCSPYFAPTFGSVYYQPCIATSTLSGPSSVQATQSGPGMISLSWNGVSGASSYTVYESSTGQSGSYTTYMTQTTSTSTALGSLNPGQTYYFAVAANGSGVGNSSPTPANPVTISY